MVIAEEEDDPFGARFLLGQMALGAPLPAMGNFDARKSESDAIQVGQSGDLMPDSMKTGSTYCIKKPYKPLRNSLLGRDLK